MDAREEFSHTVVSPSFSTNSVVVLFPVPAALFRHRRRVYKLVLPLESSVSMLELFFLPSLSLLPSP